MANQQQDNIVNPFESMMDTEVQVVTTDGRIFVGVLKGIDQAMNCVIQDCQERVYSIDEGVNKIGLGLYIIRGDTVAVLGIKQLLHYIGEIDPDIEQYLNFDAIKAHPLPPIL